MFPFSSTKKAIALKDISGAIAFSLGLIQTSTTSASSRTTGSLPPGSKGLEIWLDDMRQLSLPTSSSTGLTKRQESILEIVSNYGPI